MLESKGATGCLLRFLAATVMVAAATGLRVLLTSSMGLEGPFVLYYLCVFAAAYLLGLWPGVYTVFLSAVVAMLLFFRPGFRLDTRTPGDYLFVLLYILTSLLIVALMEQFRQSLASRNVLEGNLRLSEDTFHEIFENAREDAIILLGNDGKIQAWNSGAENITGWREDEVVGKSGNILFTAEDLAKDVVKIETAEVLARGRATDNRWHVRKDSTRFWAIGTITALWHVDGSPRGFLRIFRDETERKRLQDMLESANEELEIRVAERTTELRKLVKELEGFTYSISHDMRAPLRSMVANSQMLLLDYGDSLPEEGKDHLARISNAATKMAQLVEDLLVHARLGRAEVVRTPCNLADLAEEVAAGLPGDCRTTIRRGPNDVAQCDPDLIRLALQNLLENACKYRKKDQPAELEFGSEGNAYYVKDHGIGFDMAYVDKIFLPFERLHRDVDYPGTGIGLANVKRIIELHEGRLWVVSEPGVGSTFYFTVEVPI
jgi:PAS domain S-box-containing protein